MKVYPRPMHWERKLKLAKVETPNLGGVSTPPFLSQSKVMDLKATKESKTAPGIDVYQGKPSLTATGSTVRRLLVLLLVTFAHVKLTYVKLTYVKSTVPLLVPYAGIKWDAAGEAEQRGRIKKIE
jgi:hypothetical protein